MQMNVYLVVLFATIGANIGALINYYLAYFVGRPIVYKFANSRFGHMCLIDEDKVKHAESYFEKHGALSTFIGRLIPAGTGLAYHRTVKENEAAEKQRLKEEAKAKKEAEEKAKADEKAKKAATSFVRFSRTIFLSKSVVLYTR